jgi:signal recognition particle subunit SRP54
VLGEQAGVATLALNPGQLPVDIAKRALQAAKLGGFDVLLLDSAGRGQIDEALMAELAAVRDATAPHESLLVADALTGQDAVNVAKGFHDRIGVTGIVLTRVDGDGRGGAALSMRAVTGRAIKFVGIGEKLDALDVFDPKRVASRMLGQGDVVGLVERAAATIERDDAEKLAEKIARGQFDLDDMAAQYRQIRKMGGMSGLMGMLPGVAKVKKQISESNLDEGLLKRQEAIIGSMTKLERRNPKIIGASRKRRIAGGSGANVAEVNRLLKQHLQMADMMKRMHKMNQSGRLQSGMAPLFGQQKF